MFDFIQGDKFKELGTFTYSPKVRAVDDYDKLPNTLNLPLLKDGDIIYTHTMYVNQLFALLAGLSVKVNIISHNSDVNVGNGFTLPENIIKWHTQNVNTNNPLIESIPIGIENDRRILKVPKKEIMEAKLKTPRKIRDLLYINHNSKTNPTVRKPLYKMFAGKCWVTAKYGVNGKNFIEYLDDIYNHAFVLCPEGNGMDTHRTWETLYMGTIPIEKRNLNNRFYQDLPICFVDDWEEITEVFLLLEYRRIQNLGWNMKKLTFEYWRNKIRNGLDSGK
jgi:hypothetical protein